MSAPRAARSAAPRRPPAWSTRAPPSQTPKTAALTGVGATQLDPSQAVRNQLTNAIAVSGRGSASTGAAVSTAPETMIPLSAVTNYEFGTTPLGVNHQGLFVASTVSFNLAIGKTLSDAVTYRERHDARDRRAGHHPRLVPGHRARLPAVARQPDPGGAGGAGGDLHRARHPVRELHPPDHDPVDPAVGRHRRAAGAAALRHGVQHHRHDRRAAAGRHRQEERDHDDRRGAGARAARRVSSRATRSTTPACCASGRS